MGDKPVVVRTLDIGGDKELPYLDLPKEMNPFLGFRAIRLCLEEKDLFRTQLRALLRASVYGKLCVMFPMIATVQEFRAAKALFLEEKEKLVAEGVAVSNDIELGIMVEIPSTAVIADIFAKEVDSGIWPRSRTNTPRGNTSRGTSNVFTPQLVLCLLNLRGSPRPIRGPPQH